MVTKIKQTGIADAAVGTAQLAGDSVTAGKIVDGAVGAAEIGTDAVGADEIAAGAVGSSEIDDGSVGADDLAATLDLSDKTVTLPDGVGVEAYLEYREEQASGVSAGGFTSGAWQTRVLNMERADAGGHGSLASNEITLAPGTYECDIICPAFRVNNHQARLYNVTDAAELLVGTTEYTHNTDASVMTSSRVTGRFTLAAPKAVRVEHRCLTTVATFGFGNAHSWGTNVYTVARFWKVG